MSQHRLSFCSIEILADNLAEIIVDEGVEMDVAKVAEYHDFLLKNLKAPFALLVNKINAYSYTPGAQVALADLDEIQAMAVVAYSGSTQTITQGLTTIQRQHSWNLRIFPSRQQALDWLQTQLADIQ